MSALRKVVMTLEENGQKQLEAKKTRENIENPSRKKINLLQP